MASCIFASVNTQVDGKDLFVSGPHLEKLAKFQQAGAQISTDNAACAVFSEILFLGVKPQLLTEVLQKLKEQGVNFSGKLVISMAAGFPLDTLRSLTSADCHLVRIMPNTPAQIGEGVTAVCYTEQVTPAERAQLDLLLQKLGKCVECSEEQLNLIGVICGCGPAFVFRFMEALCAEAVRYGLTEEQAKGLVTQLLSGSVKLVEHNHTQSLSALREAVTSKGGTTFAGLQQMSSLHFEELMQAVIAASLKRSAEFEAMFKPKA